MSAQLKPQEQQTFVSGEDVLREARKLIGVTFRVGAYGFLATIARRLGVIPERVLLRYTDDPEIISSLRHCVMAQRVMSEIAEAEMQPGDVILFAAQFTRGTGRTLAEWPAVLTNKDLRTCIGAKPIEVMEHEDPGFPISRIFRFDNEKIKNPDFDPASITWETIGLARRIEIACTFERLFMTLNGQE